MNHRGAHPSWVYGRHVVEEILAGKGARVLQVYLLSNDRRKLEEMARKVKRTGARVRWVSRKDLDQVSNSGQHQGMAAQIVEKTGAGLDAWLGGLSQGAKAKTLLIALDQIQDPQNFGAIARSAACLGAAGILFPERRSAPVTQAVLRSSAGAVQRIRTFSIGNLAQTLEKLKEAGFWIYGTDRSGRPIWKVKLHRPTVLVVGSEDKGIRPLVRMHCDDLISIPHSGGVESLNASCAAAIALYEAARQLATSS